MFVSCLGTQKAIVGSVEEQRKVDYDLNLKLAKAAKEQGVETVSREDFSRCIRRLVEE